MCSKKVQGGRGIEARDFRVAGQLGGRESFGGGKCEEGQKDKRRAVGKKFNVRNVWDLT